MNKPKTMREALKTMKDPDILTEQKKWNALACFLEEFALSQGCDLDREIEEHSD